MKHRSTHIFILVAALLVAAPRASQELSAMKDDLGRRLKAEIFNAFLSLHTGDATQPAQPARDCQLASAGAPRGANRGAGPGRASVATQIEVHARREVPAEVAAITEPVVEIAELEPARMEAPAFRFELHDTKVIRGRELAMIIPPDADVMAPPPPPPPSPRQVSRKAPAPRRRAAAVEEHAAAYRVEFENALEIEGISPVELRRQLKNIQALRLDADAARTWTKVLKVKRTPPKPAAPAPAARAACPATSATATQSPQVSCGPSAFETFYAGE